MGRNNLFALLVLALCAALALVALLASGCGNKKAKIYFFSPDGRNQSPYYDIYGNPVYEGDSWRLHGHRYDPIGFRRDGRGDVYDQWGNWIGFEDIFRGDNWYNPGTNYDTNSYNRTYSAIKDKFERLLYSARKGEIDRSASFAMLDRIGAHYDRISGKLSFSDALPGDTDLDGEVSIKDLTPIALNYGKEVPQDDPDSPLHVIDTDENGEIGMSDVTPVALYYQEVLYRYEIYVENPATPEEDWSLYSSLPAELIKWNKAGRAVLEMPEELAEYVRVEAVIRTDWVREGFRREASVFGPSTEPPDGLYALMQ
ncbi:MAG: hypothetical protein HRF49_07265 [bacterium]|jgi:hypothetical protein